MADSKLLLSAAVAVSLEYWKVCVGVKVDKRGSNNYIKLSSQHSPHEKLVNILSSFIVYLNWIHKLKNERKIIVERYDNYLTHVVATEGIGAWHRLFCKKFIRWRRDGFIRTLPPDLAPPNPTSEFEQFGVLLLPLNKIKQNHQLTSHRLLTSSWTGNLLPSLAKLNLIVADLRIIP